MTPITPQRLSRMVDNAFAKTKNQRQGRVKLMSQYMGRFSRGVSRTGDEATKSSPINLLYTAVTTIVPNLVFNDPRAKLGTELLAYRNYAEILGEATTRICTRSKLKATLRGIITDGIFMAGFGKTGLAVGECVVEFGDGVDVNLTEPFMERISPDDMILDPNARSWDEQTYVGNRFRGDVEKLIEIGYGDPDKLMSYANDTFANQARDKAEDLSKTPGLPNDEGKKFVDLAEIWIPSEKRIVTIPCKCGAVFDEFIHEIDYGGPPKGQYHMLGFAWATDNLLPIAPAGIWYDLHILGNRIARKIARQAERNKRVLAYEDDAEEDVEAIADANDGETVRVADINKMKEVEYGGVSDKAYEWMNWVKANFSEQAGQLGTIGGPSDTQPTLGQEQIAQANTSVRLGDMQGLVYDFAGEMMSDTAYYLHTDPLIDLPLVRRINGVETQDYYNPDARVGEWLDYNVTVRPYSMARTDPSTAVRRKLEFATNVIPAAANAATVLGPGFKIGPFLSGIAREVGIEDADEWLNTPEVAQWIQQTMLLSQKTGDPGKAQKFLQNPMALMSPQTGFNPMQPNPSAMGPTGGISPSTEQAQAQQLATQEAQTSTKSLALARGAL